MFSLGGLLQRMTGAMRTGWNAGVHAFNEQNFVPGEEFGFDKYVTRLARYYQYDLYADNTVFTVIHRYKEQQKAQRGLYRHIRSIKNPVSRLINLETAKVYGGGIDYSHDLAGGSIPVDGADPALIAAISQVLKWSNFGQNKSDLVRTGGRYGDVFLKAIDERDKLRVRLEVLDPRKVADVQFDSVDNITAIRIEYMKMDAGSNKPYLYTELITKEKFQTFKDGEPFAFYLDFDGTPLAEWENDYGFVPVRHIKHQSATGVRFGATSFSNSLRKIDELNDLASLVHDSIRKNVNAVWAGAGNFQLKQKGAASDDNKVENPQEKRDEQPIIRFPEGTQFTPLVLPLDIEGAIHMIAEQVKEIERDMPQLTLQNIRDQGGNISGVTVRNLYGDASDALIETQGNYDAGVVAGIQMGISIGGLRGYDGFGGFNLDSYDAGRLMFTLKPRPVFPDEIDKQTRINLLLQAADSPARAVAMRDLGYSEEDIALVEESVSSSEAAAMRGLAVAAFGETDRETDRQTDNTEDAQTDEQTDRQTEEEL